jgi:hypothetical protein
MDKKPTDRTLELDVGNVKISVKLDNKGVEVDILQINKNKIGFCRSDDIIKSARKTYNELGLEIKEIKDSE